METNKIDGRTPEGSFALNTVDQKDGQYIINLTTQDHSKKIIKTIRFLFGPIKNVGSAKSAGKLKYTWIPGSASLEKNAVPRVVTLPALLARLNEAQKVYRFELVYGTLLRIKVLKDNNLTV
jgi:hypothetical protein